MTTITVPVQLRQGAAAEWAAVDPVLLSGEQGYETDTRRRKTGDGVATWTALPYDDLAAHVAPSGDATGAADLAAINAALVEHRVVRLTGDYFTGGPIEMPSGRTLLLWDAKVTLAPGSSSNIIRNKDRGPAAGNTDIRVVGVGRAILDGDPTQQVRQTNIWENQGILMSKVDRLVLEGFDIGPCALSAIHLIGVTDGRVSRIRSLQDGSMPPNAGGPNQDFLDIGPSCANIDVDTISGDSYDDFFSFYGHTSAAMIPTEWRANDYAACTDTINITVRGVDGAGNGVNFIRLNAGDGRKLRRVSFSDIHNRSDTSMLLCMGESQYAERVSRPTPADLSDITLVGFSTNSSLLAVDQRCSNVHISSGNLFGNWDFLVAQTKDFFTGEALEARNIHVSDVTIAKDTAVAGSVGDLLRTIQATALLDGVTVRNVHVNRLQSLLDNVGTVANLDMTGVSVGVANGDLIRSTTAETGRLSDVSVASYGTGFTAVLTGAPVELKLDDVPVLTSADTTPAPTKGSRIVCDNTTQADGGAGTTAAEWIGNGTAWIKAVDLGAMVGR